MANSLQYLRLAFTQVKADCYNCSCILPLIKLAKVSLITLESTRLLMHSGS